MNTQQNWYKIDSLKYEIQVFKYKKIFNPEQKEELENKIEKIKKQINELTIK